MQRKLYIASTGIMVWCGLESDSGLSLKLKPASIVHIIVCCGRQRLLLTNFEFLTTPIVYIYRRSMEGRLFVGLEISTQQVFVKLLLNSLMTCLTLCTGCYTNSCWSTRVMRICYLFPC